MKVIKENKLRCTCTKCFSVLEYTKSDITYDLRNHVARIICPICDNVMEEAKVRNISELNEDIEDEQVETIPEEDLNCCDWKTRTYRIW